MPTVHNLAELYNLYMQVTAYNKHRLKDFLKMIDNHSKKVEKNIENFWQHPINDLVITHINDRVGMGVFLSPHAEPIKKGTIVTLYAGEYDASPDQQLFHEYSYFVETHPVFSDPTMESQNKIPAGNINATKCGNLARYIQDLPTESELKEYYIIPNEKISSIATANLDGVLAIYHQFPIIYFVAARDIQPGEQLGYSYTAGYWAKAKCIRNIDRCLFDKSGQIFNDSPYINYLNLHFKINGIDHYYSFQLSKLKIGILFNQGASFFTQVTMSDEIIPYQLLLTTCQQALENLNVTQNAHLKELSDIVDAKIKLQNPTSSYQVRFCNNIRLILLEYLIENKIKRDAFSEQKVSYIKKMQASIQSLTDNEGDQTFSIIANALKDPTCSAFYKEHLPRMRNELIEHMNKYNQDKTKCSQKASEMVMSLSKRKG